MKIRETKSFRRIKLNIINLRGTENIFLSQKIIITKNIKLFKSSNGIWYGYIMYETV